MKENVLLVFQLNGLHEAKRCLAIVAKDNTKI